MHKGNYPVNWEMISMEIKHLADWKCENCEHPHDPKAGYCLTVHHLDLDKSNCTYENLVALCQKCHLSIQAYFLPGQMTFLEPPAWMIKRKLTGEK